MKSNRLLYLVCAFTAITALASWALPAGAQEKKRRGPRALAVLEMGPAETSAAAANGRKPLIAGVGFPRLLPVAVLDGGEYYDATLYQATPIPLAVQAGTVYDVQRSGIPQELFTVQQPTQLHGSWVATGKLQPAVADTASKNEPAKPQLEGDAPPRLRRNAPATERSSLPAKPAISPASLANVAAAHSLLAISDAQAYETRPYLYSWSPQQQRQLTKEMLRLAQAELAAYTHCRVVAGSKSCLAKLENMQLRAFDLETNNDIELVLAARAPKKSMAQEQQQYLYIQVVGRYGSDARLQRVFATVTDDAHLDSDGRLEFIDAVDADGDGRGELLFRRVHTRTQSFELYRVGRERMWKLFDGAESNL